MSETKTYTGGCHCGKVRYEVTAGLEKIIACNCSICAKRGSLLTFVPEDAFKLLSGEGAVTDYQFNKKRIHHLFCATCGIQSYATSATPDGKKMFAVNVRCLDDVDATKLETTPFDGKKL